MNASGDLISKIIGVSVRHKALVFAVTAVLSCLGYWCMSTMRLDAVPDLGDTQVILYTHWDQTPGIIESQVTYPIIAAMLGAPHVKTVRGFSDFGYSYVYIIFEDNTDIYWARSRVLESLSAVQAQLPSGAKTEMGPDATSLGWVYQYVLLDKSGTRDATQLRSYQDWYLRYYLRSVQGVADVASLGGFKRQYQVNVDPNQLRRYGVSMAEVVAAVRQGNVETSGRFLDFGGTEYMIRGRGYARTLEDFRDMVVTAGGDGMPVRVRDLGEVSLGEDVRRGVADVDGTGEAVSGIVVMRSGENALQVIDRVKEKINSIRPSLPPGIEIVPIYDRSTLIHSAISSIKITILQVVVTVVLIIIIFLWHFPSAAIPIVTMPVAILLAFIPLKLLGISINIMSLAGMAIAFGELIDASIVVVEQTHKRLEQWQKAGGRGTQQEVITAAVREVAGPIFFTLLVIAVSVLPVFALESQEGRMFRPLAYSKAMAMIAAAGLALTLDPALRLLLSANSSGTLRKGWIGRITRAVFPTSVRPEEQHRISGALIRLYEPVVAWTLRNKTVVLCSAAVLILATIPVFLSLGHELMPPMEEGTILYMPTTMPGISIDQAKSILTATDKILKEFPEVDRVLGKAGRAESATDPAPLSMLETLITLKPQERWRHVNTWYSGWAPGWLRPSLRHITSDTLSSEDLVAEMNRAVHVPGLNNAWTMPIRGRLDMQSTGMKTPLGVKISGGDLKQIEQVGNQIQTALSTVPGTRGVFAERTHTGYFIDINWRRDQLARYGITMEQAQEVVSSAIGGDNVTTLVSGAERYSVNVRYQAAFRSTSDALGRVLVATGGERQTPLSELATLTIAEAPGMIRDENGLLTGYVYLDVSGRDPGRYVAEAKKVLASRVAVPSGVLLSWSGEYESMERVSRRLAIAIPATFVLIVGLIRLGTKSTLKTMIVLLAVPFSAIGAIWLLYFLHYNLSVAVWLGIIGLLGIDAETGVFMLLYLDLAYDDAKKAGRLRSIEDLREAISYGAAKRLRPKVMTFATTCVGLLPVMWSMGIGSDVMKRIAAPMVGGIFTSFLLELLVYPVIYEIWKKRYLPASSESTAISADSSDRRLTPEYATP